MDKDVVWWLDGNMTDPVALHQLPGCPALVAGINNGATVCMFDYSAVDDGKATYPPDDAELCRRCRRGTP